MARKLINVKEISNEQWLQLRKKSLGGSDASSVIGINPWSSPLTLYADKLDVSIPKETKSHGAMWLGKRLEDDIAQLYEEVEGKKTRKDNIMWVDDEYSFLTANVDRRIIGENAGVEIKSMSRERARKYDLEGGEAPEEYRAQCMHYLMILGWDYIDLAIYVLQEELYVIRIERDEEYIKDLREREIDFWTNYVMKKEMPAPDGSESSTEALKAFFPEAVSEYEVVDYSFDHLVEDYKEFARLERFYKTEKERVKDIACGKIGQNSYGRGAKWQCSWKPTSRTTIDSARLKKELPSIYAKYAKTSTTRRFNTKEIKKEK